MPPKILVSNVIYPLPSKFMKGWTLSIPSLHGWLVAGAVLASASLESVFYYMNGNESILIHQTFPHILRANICL